ncbi:uncharacterized protein LOC124161312 [Ischnura elegans]|uniref:uncharacterized protein LOC124161312 n=1 Tax=Ischnura elegans TaxID=197161 RepID=UPI001ED873E4|nr:uncharacterized protein LOC124161312 [Ischnura elegans]
MKCTKEGENLSKVSPFLIRRVLSSAIPGDLVSVKKIRGDDTRRYRKLLQLEKLHDIPITVEPNKTLNTCRGVVTCFDLLYVDVEEIKTEMPPQGAIECSRFIRKQNGQVINATSIILKFTSDSLPDKVFVGYTSYPVRPYIPNPVRCFNCQLFGHISSRCRGTAACARCGEGKHENENCSSKAHCVNCDGDHPVYSRDCPKLKDEKKIVEIKTLEKISYLEARKKLNAQKAPIFSRSFASVASVSVRCASTQTDFQKIQDTLVEKRDQQASGQQSTNNGNKQTDVSKKSQSDRKDKDPSLPKTQTPESPPKRGHKKSKSVSPKRGDNSTLPGPQVKSNAQCQMEEMEYDGYPTEAEVSMARKKGKSNRLRR